MNRWFKTVKGFKAKEDDRDLVVKHFGENELYINVQDGLDECSASFVLGDNDQDREKAKQLLEVIQSYINKSA